MTSNIGSDLLQQRIEAMGGELSSEAGEQLQREILGLLKQRLRPEFLNRIDETVLFNQLAQDQIRRVVEIQFGTIQALAERSHGIQLILSPEARDYLAVRGYDPAFGARPVKRVLQREITNKLAEEVLSGWVADGRTVSIDVAASGEGLTFSFEDNKASDFDSYAPDTHDKNDTITAIHDQQSF